MCARLTQFLLCRQCRLYDTVVDAMIGRGCRRSNAGQTLFPYVSIMTYKYHCKRENCVYVNVDSLHHRWPYWFQTSWTDMRKTSPRTYMLSTKRKKVVATDCKRKVNLSMSMRCWSTLCSSHLATIVHCWTLPLKSLNTEKWYSKKSVANPPAFCFGRNCLYVTSI